MSYTYRTLGAGEVAQLRELISVFAYAFEDQETYASAPPSEAYLTTFLSKPHTIVVVAMRDDKIVGGLVAYELEKYEQERKEVYIYDLAVAEAHRRRGIATALIHELQRVVEERGAYVIYVQADDGDDAAIALYESLGTKESVFHFDIPVPRKE